MPRFALVLGAVLAFSAAGAAAANPVQQSPIVVRITDPPLFLSSPHCAVLLLREKLRAQSGQVIGSADFCFQTDVISGDTETLTADTTFHVPAGTIDADVTQVEVPAPPYSVLATFTGTVTRATGHYLGTGGSVTGSGPIFFDVNGVPHPDLTFTIALS
jgi:hypothetical protein